MTRINLLPSEILEKRRSERRVFYYAGGFLVLLVFLSTVYGFGAMQIRSDQQRLDELRAANAKLNKTITEYQVYEQRKAELQRLEKIVQTALSGEIAWHKILNEVSMVIPSDVWLEEFSGSIAEGVICKGYAVDYGFDTPDLGHKPVAEWIVRMNEIKVLASVWLNYSQKAKYKEKPAIQFEITTQLKGEQPASAPAAPPAK